MEKLLEAPAMSSRLVAAPVGARIGYTNFNNQEVTQVLFAGPFDLSLSGKWEFFLNGSYLTQGQDYNYIDGGVSLIGCALYPGDRLEGVFLGLERPFAVVVNCGVRKRIKGRLYPDLKMVIFEQLLPPDANGFDLYIGGRYIAPREILFIDGGKVKLNSLDPSWDPTTQGWANFFQID